MAGILQALPSILTALQVPLTAGVFGLLGVWLTTRITKGQLEVSRQTLFVSMLPRRIEWLDQFRKAVADWDQQMQAIIGYEGSEPPPPTALFEIGRLRQEAVWLFGGEVVAISREIEEQLEIVTNLRISARSGSRESAARVGSAVYKAYTMLGSLSAAAKPKLFVGDIERPPSVVKVPRALKSVAGKAFFDS